MTVLLTVALLSHSLSFPGGDAKALVDAIHGNRQNPVVLLFPGQVTFPAFSFTWSSGKDFNRLLKLKCRLFGHSSEPAYYPEWWPSYMTDSREIGPAGLLDPLLKLSIDEWPIDKSGTVRAETPALLRLRDLEASTEGKIQVHWFLADAAIVIAGKAPISEFLPLIATATGAVLQTRSGIRKLSVSPAAYRTRMLARLHRDDLEKPSRPLDREERALAREVLKFATDRQLGEALQSTERTLVVVAPQKTPMALAVERRLRAYAARQDVVVQPGTYSPAQLVDMVDFTRPIEVKLFLEGARIATRAYGRNGAPRLTF